MEEEMVSIIVTHKRSMHYLKDCLDSIADQTFKDYETILVLDHTEDDMADIEKEYKDKINLKIYELPEDKTGVAAARNYGVDKACGEYIFFLDNDDYLYNDTIKQLLDKMDDETDMSYGLIHHTWFMRSAYNDEQQGEDTEDNEEDIRLIEYDFSDPFDFLYNRFMKLKKVTVLGAVYRKSMIDKYNIRFNEDNEHYPDAAYLITVLKKARKITSDIEARYVKRHHNDLYGNPALTQLSKEVTMPSYLKMYDDCIKVSEGDEKFIKKTELMLCKFITLVYIKKIRYMKDERWANEWFDEIYKRVKDVHLKWHKKDFKMDEKAMLKAFMEGDFNKMQKKSVRVLFRRKVKRIIINSRARNKAITLHIFSKLSLKENWIVFESFYGRNCSGQPKYIYQYLQENYPGKFKCIWVVDRRGIVINGKYKRIKRMSLRYFYYMNRSKYWVNNMRQPMVIPRRPETKLVATWHGTPLKRLVFDMDDVHAFNPRYKNIVYRQTRQWDYMLSDNPYSTEKFQSCFRLERSQILESGYPANDPFYAEDRDERAKKIKKKLGIPEDKKVIFYAPTWRDDQFYDEGEYKYEQGIDIKKLQENFSDEYVLLMRLHYFIVDQLDLKQYGDFTVDGSRYDDITDLYLISDILVTDYSSVFFDFANLRRPMLFYTYDYDKYKDVLHGFYFDMNKELPGPLLMTMDELVDALKNIDKITEQYKDKYDEFYDKFCCIDDGHAAERVVKTVFFND